MIAPEPSKGGNGAPSIAPSITKAGVRKTIGFIGSISLLVNNVTGGSMVVLPQTFRAAGWVLPVLCSLGVALLACLCGVLLIEAMALVPGNHRFAKRLEYTNLANLLLPRKLYWVVQIFYQLSILAQNVAMIVQSVQVMDFTLVALTGYSCAMPQLAPSFAFRCSYPGGFVSDGINPFGDWYLVSLGWVVTAVLVLPLGFINLDDNDAVQQGGFVAVLAIVGVWCGLSFTDGTNLSAPPAFGGNYDTLMGSILFNFAINYTLPSWVNEKKDKVPVVRSLLISLLLSAAMFIMLGFCGAYGFPSPTNNQTLLNQIYNSSSKLGAITFYLFPACVNLTTIPVNSIMQRYNLEEAGVCGRRWALFWGVISPWLIAIPLYTGSGYETLVSWSGLVLVSSVNFVLPPIFYLLALRKYGTGPNALRTIHDAAKLSGESSSSRHGPRSASGGTRGPASRRKSFYSFNCMRSTTAGGAAGTEAQTAPLTAAEPVPPSFQAIVETSAAPTEAQILEISPEQLDSPTEAKMQEPVVEAVSYPLESSFRCAVPPLQPIASPSAGSYYPLAFQLLLTTGEVATARGGAGIPAMTPIHQGQLQSLQPVPPAIELVSPASGSAAAPAPAAVGVAAPGAASSFDDDEWGEEDEAERIAHAEWEQRQAEKEAARRARVLRRLRRRRDKAAALQANPDEVPSDHEKLKLLPQVDLSPPSDWREQPLLLAYWLIALPWHLILRLTVPHLTDERGVSDSELVAAAAGTPAPALSSWPLRFCVRLLIWCPLSLVAWSVGLSFCMVWSSAVIARVTGFHAFPFGVFVLGIGIRAPHLLSEYRAYAAGQGDLNRMFANTVWQLLVCLPLSWLLTGGSAKGDFGTHVVFTSSLPVVALTLFLLTALLLIVLRAYHWIVVRAVGLAAVAATVTMVLVAFLLDYSVIMERSLPFCDNKE